MQQGGGGLDVGYQLRFLAPGALLGGPLVHGRRLRADHDELGDVEPHDEPADLVVRGDRVRAELAHHAEHGPGPAAALARHRRQGLQAGPHRLGVGVEGVVEDRDAVGAGDDLHAPRGPPFERRQPRGDRRRGRAQFEGDRRGGQRVADVVLAVQRERDVGVTGRGDQPEGSAGLVVEGDALRADVGGRGLADEHHAGLRPARHGRDQRVVQVEDRDAVFGQRLDQLALGLRDAFAGAELADVRGADVEHHADLRRGDLGEVGDVPRPARGQFQHQVPGARVGPQGGPG